MSPTIKDLFDMLLLVCRHRGLDMRSGGDGGRFGGLKGGADGLRVELRIFGDAIIYRSLFLVCCPSRSLKLQSRAKRFSGQMIDLKVSTTLVSSISM